MAHPARSLLLLSLLLGCGAPATVVVDGVTVPRPTLEYAGQPYTIRHSRAHPQPGGASSGLRSPGGTITGQVCGVDLDYEVDHRGDHVQIIGSVSSSIDASGRVDVHIEVVDKHGVRSMTGGIGTKTVDLRVTPDRVLGWVGANGFGVARQEDRLVGAVHTRQNQQLEVPVVLNGRTALWQMPAAPQAAVLPLVLLCLYSDLRYQFGHAPPALGFGGAATAMPRGTLEIHSR